MFGIYHEAQRGSPEIVCGVKEEHGEEHEKKDQDTLFRQWRRVYKRSFPTVMPWWGHKRHFTVKETPQQNRVAEMMNVTLLEKVWCMLSNASIVKYFWAKVLAYACHLVKVVIVCDRRWKLLWKFVQKKLLMIMIRYGYLSVRSTSCQERQIGLKTKERCIKIQERYY